MSGKDEEKASLEEEEQFNAEDEVQDDLEDELSEEEEATAREQKKKKKKKRSIFIDDAAEDDDDDGAPKLKRSRFIDDIAEVDDDEEEDEDEEGMDDLIDDQDQAPDADDVAELRRAQREVDNQLRKEEEFNPEELENYLKERYSRGRAAAYAAGGEEAEADGAVAQQALMPTVRDPKLWVVRCVDGAEREVVVCLLQKCYDLAAKGQPLLIKSAFAKDQLQGYIYVEAHKEAHVRDAMRGLRAVFASKPPKLVPLGEMVAAVTPARSSTRSIQPGAWVRMRTGVYKGDLARVNMVDINAGRLTVRMVPRLDYQTMAKRRTAEETRAAFGKQPKVRPGLRAFNPDEARSFGLDVLQQRDRTTGEVVFVLNNSQRFSQGYLVKTLAIKSVALEETMPPLDELQRFNAASQEEGGDATDLASLVAGLDGEGALDAAVQGKFAKGDRVIVIDGDLKDIKGRVELVTEDGQIMVLPTDDTLAGFNEAIGFVSRELSKFFEGGDHVKVVHGSHSGETGMVVRVEGAVCFVFTDATRQEIKVFARDLADAVTSATTLDSLGDYDLFDLVVLDSQTVGVIVGVDKDSCRVLTNQGHPEKPDVRVCRLTDLKRKVNNRRATAMDGTRNEVSYDDIVEVIDGPLRGHSGTVKHLMRGFLFVHSREVQDNGGFVCLQARHCRVRGGKRMPGSFGAGGVMATPARAHATPNPYGSSGVLASPAHSGGGGGGGFGGARGAPAGGGGYGGRLATQEDRLLVGKVVEIRNGPYRGMRGKVKSATATHVRVELEARMQTVSVSRAHLGMQDGGVSHAAGPSMGMGMGMGQYGIPAGGGTAAPGGRTPAHWSSGVTATPAHYGALGSATPLHPSMTPGREALGKTPAYDAAWAATPAHPGILPGPPDTQEFTGYGGMPGFGSAPAAYATAPQTSAPAAAGPSAAGPVRGPVPGSTGQDWVGLEAVLPDGDHVAVRSVTASGEASVQVGREIPGGGYIFSDGSVRNVPVADLELASYSRGDTIKILVGDFKGQSGGLTLIDKGEVFFQTKDSQVQVVQAALIGKQAVDAKAS